MEIKRKEMMIYILNHDEIFTHNTYYQIDDIKIFNKSNHERFLIMITYLVSDNNYTMMSYNINSHHYLKFLRKMKLSKLII